MGIPRSVPLKDITLDDAYWRRYVRLILKKTLPYQWEILNDRVADAPPSYCLRNLRIAAGEDVGERKGAIFQDSDVAKWLEAVAYSLSIEPDKELMATADEVIALIGRAQCEDGYLNTYYTLVEPEGRWQNLTEGHELYCAGHFIEAAVAYFDATGKRTLLDIMCRFSDLLCRVFGPGGDQLHGYPGHPEIELALLRLYGVTGHKPYLELAKYFVDERGKSPNYFIDEIERRGGKAVFPEFSGYDPKYSQSHIPVRQQEAAEGHAVRAVYLYCAMADLAYLYNDETLLRQCEKLWANITRKRMYITGSIGSSGFWERFTTDYDLPNDSNYSETCASIGLSLFGLRMARITRDASYIDIVERALYNTVRAGISLEGDRYFYVNPLEVQPLFCGIDNTSKAHVKPVRQKWFDVACCPTNVARTFTALGQYIYSAGENELFVNLFVQNETRLSLGGRDVRAALKTDYPKTGKVTLELDGGGAEFALYLRVPAFAGGVFTVLLNGKDAGGSLKKGFYAIDRVWGHDTVEFSFELRPKLVYANPIVSADAGKAAIMRGPEIYCFEEADNGARLAGVCIKPEAVLNETWVENLFGGTMTVSCEGLRIEAWDTEESYSTEIAYNAHPVKLTAIPYGSWNNRGPGEMAVWLRAVL